MCTMTTAGVWWARAVRARTGRPDARRMGSGTDWAVQFSALQEVCAGLLAKEPL